MEIQFIPYKIISTIQLKLSEVEKVPFAEVNGVKIYYEIYGDGEPIVFIHGIGVTSRMWRFQREEISKHFKMIVFDLRGSGKSGRTPEVEHTAELFSEDLNALLDYLKLSRVNIAAVSLGTAIAMKFAIDHGDRVGCLILSGAFGDLHGFLHALSRYFPGVIGRMLMTRFFGELATKVMLPSAPKSELLYYHRNIISIDRDEVRKYSQFFRSYSITPALTKIKVPTLILYGAYEPMLHKYGRIIQKSIKNSRMRVIPGVGHGWNGEKPALFNKLVMGFIYGHSWRTD